MRRAAAVDDVAELGGKVLGGGPPEADGDDLLVAAAAEADERDRSGGPTGAAGALVVDLDEQWGGLVGLAAR